MKKVKAIVGLVSVIILILYLGSCDGDDGDDVVDCNPSEGVAFSPIPECLADYFIDNPTTCTCEGEEFLFGFDIGSDVGDPNTGSMIGNNFTWMALDCSSISFSGDVSGTLEQMTALEEGVFEFIRIFDGDEPDTAICCSVDAVTVL